MKLGKLRKAGEYQMNTMAKIENWYTEESFEAINPFDPKRVSIVIPALNEEVSIERVIRGVSKYTAQILVVDGHSNDMTVAIARRLGVEVIWDKKKGKGDAIRTAINHLKGDVVVFIDADGSHDPSSIPAMVQPILDGRYDHITGSRLLGGSSELHGGFDECLRLMGSAFITACINKRFNVRLSDSQNGFRAIRTSVLRELRLRENKTTIEQEMIMETLHQGFKMGEIPTHEYKRIGGVSKIKLSRVWLGYGICLARKLLPKRMS